MLNALIILKVTNTKNYNLLTNFSDFKLPLDGLVNNIKFINILVLQSTSHDLRLNNGRIIHTTWNKDNLLIYNYSHIGKVNSLKNKYYS